MALNQSKRNVNIPVCVCVCVCNIYIYIYIYIYTHTHTTLIWLDRCFNWILQRTQNSSVPSVFHFRGIKEVGSNKHSSDSCNKGSRYSMGKEGLLELSRFVFTPPQTGMCQVPSKYSVSLKVKILFTIVRVTTPPWLNPVSYSLYPFSQ